MSELDNAIKRLKENADNKELPYIIADIIKNNCSQEVIKLILQKLKEYDNAKPSEAMECLERVCEWTGYDEIYTKTDLENDINTIKQALLKAQEQENKAKAFDLINEKRVDIKTLHWAYPNVEAYNVWVRENNKTFWRKELTPEEFEFIGRLAGAK